MGIETRIMTWLDRRDLDRLLDKCGGIQTCPWRRQVAQRYEQPRFECCKTDHQLDVIHCGNCGGTSLWLFAVGMIYLRPLDAPLPFKGDSDNG